MYKNIQNAIHKIENVVPADIANNFLVSQENHIFKHLTILNNSYKEKITKLLDNKFSNQGAMQNNSLEISDFSDLNETSLVTSDSNFPHDTDK